MSNILTNLLKETSPSRLLCIVLTDFLALRLFCFNIRQHGCQILFFTLHVHGRKFNYRRPQVVHRCPKCSLLIVSTHVLRLKAAESFLETSQCTHFTEKSGLRDVKRADFIRYWRRSGLKIPDKPKIFIRKNERNHSYHQFYPVLAKIQINRIRINRGLLYERIITFSQKRGIFMGEIP